MPMTIDVREVNNCNLHGFSRLAAENNCGHSWIRFYTKDHKGVCRAELAVFMPHELAQRIEAAFHDYEDWESSQETAPISEYTDALADFSRQQEDAMVLK